MSMVLMKFHIDFATVLLFRMSLNSERMALRILNIVSARCWMGRFRITYSKTPDHLGMSIMYRRE
jgi:hypothetical protein